MPNPKILGARSVRIGSPLPAALLCAALVSSSPLRAETGWGGGGGQVGSEAGGAQCGGEDGDKVPTPLQPGCYHIGQFSPWIVNRSAIAPSVSGPARVEMGWAGTVITVNLVTAPAHATIDQIVSVSDLIQKIKEDQKIEKSIADSKEGTVDIWLFDEPRFNNPVLVSKSVAIAALKTDEESKADAVRGLLGIK